MKPNTRVINYVSLVQDGVLTLDDVPQDITKETTKWLRYLSGVENDGMVKDTDTGTDPAPKPETDVKSEPKKETKPVLGDPLASNSLLGNLNQKAGE